MPASKPNDINVIEGDWQALMNQLNYIVNDLYHQIDQVKGLTGTTSDGGTATSSQVSVKVGVYKGTSAAGLNVTGVGFEPKFVLVMPMVYGKADGTDYQCWWKLANPSAPWGDLNLLQASPAIDADVFEINDSDDAGDGIQSFSSDGFRVKGAANTDNTWYEYIAARW